MIGDLQNHIIRTLAQGDDLAEGEVFPDSKTVDLATNLVTPVWHTLPTITSIYDGDVRFVWERTTRRGVLAVLADGRHYWFSSRREDDDIVGEKFEFGIAPERLEAEVAWVLESPETGGLEPEEESSPIEPRSAWGRLVAALRPKEDDEGEGTYEVSEVES